MSRTAKLTVINLVAGSLFALGGVAHLSAATTPNPTPRTVHVDACDAQGQPVGDFRTCLDHDSKGLPFVTDGTHRLYVKA